MNIKDYVITGRSNPVVSDASKLLRKKYRDESGRFLIDGRKLSYEYLRSCGKCSCVFVKESSREQIIGELYDIEREKNTSFEVTVLSDQVFSRLTEQSSPDGVIVIGYTASVPVSYKLTYVESDERVIILDSLQDPGNVGTLIRSALAFDFDRVILSADCADPFNPKTLRASMGAVFSLELTVVDSVSDAVGNLLGQGRNVYAAELRENSIPIDSVDILKSDVFIIGNEGHGISADISEMCTGSVFIPISERSESLNAAVAGSVLMWQQQSRFQIQ